MDLQKLAGIILIFGAVLYTLAMLVAPRLYQEEDLHKRMEIIEAQTGRWNLSQLLFGLGMLLPGLGFLVLATGLPPGQLAWMQYLGGAAFLAGGILGALLIYRQTMDPLRFWEEGHPESTGDRNQILIVVGNGYLFLTMIGFLLFGIVFLLASSPAWLGILNIAVALLGALVYLLRRGRGAFFLTILFYLVALIDGIMALRG
jgi:MFS family permease